MSNKNDYTPEEWQTLMDVPMLVGAAVMVIGKSGLGTMKESFTLAHETLGAIKSYPDNELIQSILEARVKGGEKSSIESFSSPLLKKRPEEFKDEVVKICRQGNAILASKASPQEAAEYKAWVREIADKVAHAASEGGFLGFGGTRFSDEEKVAIEEIHDALNIA